MEVPVICGVRKVPDPDGSGGLVPEIGLSTARVHFTRHGQAVQDPADAEDADIDLLNYRVPASYELLGTAPPPGLRSVHIHNATIEFGGKDGLFAADKICSTFRFSNIKFIFHMSAFARQGYKDRLQSLFIAWGRNCTMALEDCVLETSFDSPALAHLVVCWATDGGQVTVTRCKFSGFRRILDVFPGSQALMKDCVVDVAIPGNFGDGPKDNLAFTVDGEGAFLHMIDCHLSISCGRISSPLRAGFLHLENDCRAELEGVTFIGRTDLAASKAAPGISMALSHEALQAHTKAHVQMRGCTIVNGKLSSVCKGTFLDLDNCHVSCFGSFLGGACVQLAGGSGSLRHCTFQNLCTDLSRSKVLQCAVVILQQDGEVGRVDLEDCLLETMTGGCNVVAHWGQATLTRCTLRKHASSPASLMAMGRDGALFINGPANVAMDHCYVEAGLNQPAVRANERGQLTCKDSLLVGWGGAAGLQRPSCPVVGAEGQGTSVNMQGCTLQYHPHSKHTLEAYVVALMARGHAALSQCRLIGPAPSNTTGDRVAVASFQQGTGTLVKCTLFHTGCAAHQDMEGSLKFVNCFSEKMALTSTPPKAPEGRGCSAEVAAKAEALHAVLYKSEAATASTGSADKAAGGSTDANPAAVECAVCRRKPGDPGVPATLKLCSGCQDVRYCSTECQKKDWKMGHKAVCQLYQKMSQAYTEMLLEAKKQAEQASGN